MPTISVEEANRRFGEGSRLIVAHPVGMPRRVAIDRTHLLGLKASLVWTTYASDLDVERIYGVEAGGRWLLLDLGGGPGIRAQIAHCERNGREWERVAVPVEPFVIVSRADGRGASCRIRNRPPDLGAAPCVGASDAPAPSAADVLAVIAGHSVSASETRCGLIHPGESCFEWAGSIARRALNGRE